MKKTIVVVALSLSTGALMMWSQAAASVESKVTRMEKEWWRSPVIGDATIIERMEADGIFNTLPDGSVATKSQDMEDVRSRKLTAKAIDLSDFKVQSFGSIAVVAYKVSITKGKYGPSDVSGDFRFTDTWRNVAGKWQVVASQGTPIQH